MGEKKSDKGRNKQNYVNTGSKDPWTEEEEFKMIVAHRKHKNKWSEMTDLIKGRNNNTIKNKFYSVFRKIKSKIQKADYKFESKLELLETYYIISLIEYHLENPTQYPKTKGKRGKDFIYSLIYNLTLEMVRNYKERMRNLQNDNVEDLVKELTEYYLNGTHTAYQTPALYPPLIEDKIEFQNLIKNIHIESQTMLDPSSNFFNGEFEDLLDVPFKHSNPEISPILELGNFTPGQLLSPASHSSEPPVNVPEVVSTGGFEDISSSTKVPTEERGSSGMNMEERG
jgi:hypothetical protein